MNHSRSRADQCLLLKDVMDKQNHMYVDRETEKLFLLILYGTVIVTGALENLFVIFTILAHRALRNLRTSFIAHLACSDLMLCVLTAPTTLWFSFNSFWEFGEMACKLVAALQALNTFLSLLTLTAIAWDRYLLVICPVRWRRPKKALVSIMTGVWLLSLLVAAPYFFAVGTAEYRHGIWNRPAMESYLRFCSFEHPRVCIELFPGSGFFSKRTFTVGVFICQYLFPLSGLVFVYGNVVRHMLTGRKCSVASRSQLQNVQRRQRNTIYLVTALVLVFGVCWLPSNLYCTLDALGVVIFDQFLYIYFHLFGMVTACINPVLYGLLNNNIRKSVSLSARNFLSCCLTRAPRTPVESIELASRCRDGEIRGRSCTVPAKQRPVTSERRIRSARTNQNQCEL